MESSVDNYDNVSINIDKVGESLDSYIAKALVAHKLPKCFGHAYPDVIAKDQEFSLEDISAHRQESPGDAISLMLLLSKKELRSLQDRVVTIEGIRKIEELKKKLADNFANSLVECAECKLFDRCSEITKNHAQAVSMNLLNKLKNI